MTHNKYIYIYIYIHMFFKLWLRFRFKPQGSSELRAVLTVRSIDVFGNPNSLVPNRSSRRGNSGSSQFRLWVAHLVAHAPIEFEMPRLRVNSLPNSFDFGNIVDVLDRVLVHPLGRMYRMGQQPQDLIRSGSKNKSIISSTTVAIDRSGLYLFLKNKITRLGPCEPLVRSSLVRSSSRHSQRVRTSREHASQSSRSQQAS
jgi:hypothetical protein